MDAETILAAMFAASFTLAGLGVASLREPLINPPRFRWYRVGGLRHWRAWRVGGSFYIQRELR